MLFVGSRPRTVPDGPLTYLPNTAAGRFVQTPEVDAKVWTYLPRVYQSVTFFSGENRK